MMRVRVTPALSVVTTCLFLLAAAILLNAVATAARAELLPAVLADHPVAYWRLDQSTGDFVSVIGGNYPGTDVNHLVTRGIDGPQPPAFPGLEAANKGILLNNTPGSGTAVNYVSVAHDTAFNPEQSDWTIEAWVYLTATQGAEGYIVSKMDGSRNGYGLELPNTNVPMVTFREAAGHGGYSQEVLTVAGSAALSLNSWHHLVSTIVRNATETQDRVTVYVDGNQVGTLLSDKVFGWSLTPTGSLTTGALGSNFGFKGSIDEVALYRTALTTDQVQAHYHAAFTVPEPASSLMGGSGFLLGIAAYGWRRRKRSEGGGRPGRHRRN
jgi:hypothetical protein